MKKQIKKILERYLLNAQVEILILKQRRANLYGGMNQEILDVHLAWEELKQSYALALWRVL